MAARATKRRATPRTTLSEIVEKQLAILGRVGTEHSSVKLIRNARGDTQLEVTVRTGENGIVTAEQAAIKAQELYDALAQAYPLRSGVGL